MTQRSLQQIEEMLRKKLSEQTSNTPQSKLKQMMEPMPPPKSLTQEPSAGAREIAGLLPGVGTALDIKDIAGGDYSAAPYMALGLLPGGGLLKKGAKRLKKFFGKADDAADVAPRREPSFEPPKAGEPAPPTRSPKELERARKEAERELEKSRKETFKQREREAAKAEKEIETGLVDPSGKPITRPVAKGETPPLKPGETPAPVKPGWYKRAGKWAYEHPKGTLSALGLGAGALYTGLPQTWFRAAKKDPIQAITSPIDATVQQKGEELKDYFRTTDPNVTVDTSPYYQTEPDKTKPEQQTDDKTKNESSLREKEEAPQYTKDQYIGWAKKYAEQFNVPLPMILHAMFKETGWLGDPERMRTATSPTGARGVMQIQPQYAEKGAYKIKVQDLTDPEKNIEAGVRGLAYYFNKYKDPQKALAAYNAGEGGAATFLKTGDPRTIRTRETRKYIQDYKDDVIHQLEKFYPKNKQKVAQVATDVLATVVGAGTAQAADERPVGRGGPENPVSSEKTKTKSKGKSSEEIPADAVVAPWYKEWKQRNTELKRQGKPTIPLVINDKGEMVPQYLAPDSKPLLGLTPDEEKRFKKGERLDTIMRDRAKKDQEKIQQDIARAKDLEARLAQEIERQKTELGKGKDKTLTPDDPNSTYVNIGPIRLKVDKRDPLKFPSIRSDLPAVDYQSQGDATAVKPDAKSASNKDLEITDKGSGPSAADLEKSRNITGRKGPLIDPDTGFATTEKALRDKLAQRAADEKAAAEKEAKRISDLEKAQRDAEAKRKSEKPADKEAGKANTQQRVPVAPAAEVPAADAKDKPAKINVRKEFEKAFAAARADQALKTGKGSGGVFTWTDPRTGKEGTFTTDYGDEVKDKKSVKVVPKAEPKADTGADTYWVDPRSAKIPYDVIRKQVKPDYTVDADPDAIKVPLATEPDTDTKLPSQTRSVSEPDRANVLRSTSGTPVTSGTGEPWGTGTSTQADIERAKQELKSVTPKIDSGDSDEPDFGEKYKNFWDKFIDTVTHGRPPVQEAVDNSINTQSNADLQDILRLAGRLK